ncbi:hypothetical protein ACJ41O_009161 [Fusarium nematophilum]
MHEALLNACRESKTCKRFIPSEYLGNLRDGGLFPPSSYSAHGQFRDMLKSETEVKWTLVNQGWLADYFVQPANGSRSYIRPFPQGWPIDLDQKTVRLIGTGDESVTWTAARDMAKVVVKLMSHEEWPDHVYLSGETGTWNDAVATLEKFLGHELKVSFGPRYLCTQLTIQRIPRTKEEIDADLKQTDEAKRYTASIDEWSLLGAASVPPEEAARQRERYFKDVHLRSIKELLESSKHMKII